MSDKRRDRGVRIFPAHYRESDWEELRRISADAEELAPTYAEWRRGSDEQCVYLEEAGLDYTPIDINLAHLQVWCADRGLPIDARSRARFAADTGRELDLLGPRVRQVLFGIWDPAGVRHLPRSSGEYDRFIPDVTTVLFRGSSREQLLLFLEGIETIRMGLSRSGILDRQRARAVDRLLELRREWEQERGW